MSRTELVRALTPQMQGLLRPFVQEYKAARARTEDIRQQALAAVQAAEQQERAAYKAMQRAGALALQGCTGLRVDFDTFQVLEIDSEPKTVAEAPEGV